MSENQWYGLFILLSVMLLLVAGYYMFVRKPKLGKKSFGITRLMQVSGILLGSTFCLRYAVGLYMNWHPKADYVVLDKLEEVANSFVHALQTFSMDEDYTGYIQNGKEMVRYALADCKNAEAWATAMGWYSSFISFIAPIAGGALLLDILANLLPNFRLWIVNGKIWRPKYYFNELNDRSILFAGSLQKAYIRNPVFIFAKAGKDTSDDLLAAAKKLDAICMEQDLEHIRKCRLGRRNYFLISEDENVNLRTLAGLSQQSCGGYLSKANIYLFTTGDAYIQLESKMYENLTRWGMPDDKLPLLYPVRTAHNMISSLLRDVPLYEPLIHKAGRKEKLKLKLTILGCGTYGMEMLLSSYSFGQILDVDLDITVVSKEEPQEFWDKLYAASPEFVATTQAQDPILHYNHDQESNSPYCSIKYHSYDVHSQGFLNLLCTDDEATTIRDTDYFLVSLGDDSRNIAASELLTRYIGAWHLENPDARTVIACVVTDSDMDRLLGEQHSVDESIYLHVIGGIHEAYSVENVLLLKNASEGDVQHAKYMLHNRAELMKKQRKRQRDVYSFYSSIAKVMHKKYRIFAVSRMLPNALLTDSVFTTEGHKSARYIKQQSQADERYLKFLGSNGATENATELFQKIMHALAWMEHRRWNAYIRASGFRYTKGDRKNLKLKLHPCLVECSGAGILAKIEKMGKIQQYSLKLPTGDPDKTPTENYPDMQSWMAAYGRKTVDLLDELSFRLNNSGVNDYDYKLYDYPNDHLDSDNNLLPEAYSEFVKQDGEKQIEQLQQVQESWWQECKRRTQKVIAVALKKPAWLLNLQDLLSTNAGKGGALQYRPSPMELDRIKLPAGWESIREAAARAVHDAWMQQRKEDGWEEGEQRDDGLRTNPCMIAYDQLPDSDKAYDIATAEVTMKSVIAFGYVVQPKAEGTETDKDLLKDVLEQIAANIHEWWAAKRMAEGWSWGEIRDDAKKQTPCMIPYVSLPESEKKYDRLTAESTLKVITKHYVICKASQDKEKK